MTDSQPTLGVGMVGYAFMGAVHSQAWRSAGRFFDLPLAPAHDRALRPRRRRGTAAAERMGWASVETDWKELVTRDDVHLVDICTPGDTHAEIAIAALEAGKHVLCEKPLANTVAEAEAMVQAAAAAEQRGVRSMVGFNYRRVPAIALARKLVGRRAARHDPARPGAVPPGLDRRPVVPAGLAAAEGQGGFRCARRHRRAHHRPRPARARLGDHRRLRAHRDVRPGTPAAGGVDRPVRLRERGHG